MPDLPNRNYLEAQVAAEVNRLQSAWRQDLVRKLGEPPDPARIDDKTWEDQERQLAVLLMLMLGPVYRNAAVNVWTTVGGRYTAPGDVYAATEAWAVDYAKQTAAGIVATTRKELADKLKDTNDKREALLALLLLLGMDRANTIAVTELTRANTMGELEAADRIAAEADAGGGPRLPTGGHFDVTPHPRSEAGRGGYTTVPPAGAEVVGRPAPGRRLIIYWNAVEGACKHCRPLHLTDQYTWRQVFPNGPPEPHPVCRCYLTYVWV